MNESLFEWLVTTLVASVIAFVVVHFIAAAELRYLRARLRDQEDRIRLMRRAERLRHERDDHE